MGVIEGTVVMDSVDAKGYVGTTANGERVWLEIKLEVQNPRDTDRTTEHEPITAPFYRLSIMGSGVDKGRRLPAYDIDFGGQIVDHVRAITHPSPEWTVADLAALADLWDRWHLNDMRAGCAHVTPVMEDRYGRTVPSLDSTPACPESGYRYGHAWLTELMPDEVIAAVRGYADRLDGGSPTRS